MPSSAAHMREGEAMLDVCSTLRWWIFPIFIAEVCCHFSCQNVLCSCRFFFYCQPIQVLLFSICINVIGVTSKCLIKYYVKSFYCLSLHKRYNKIERANQTLFRRYFTFKVSNMLVCFPPALALNVIRPVASYEVKTSVNLSCSTIKCVLWEWLIHC